MNKTLFSIIFIFGFSQLSALEQKWMNKTEVRGAAFEPASHRFRKIYGNVLPSLQIEQARRFANQPYLELWGNFEWIFANGTAGHSCGKSSIDILNLSMGLKGIGSVYRDWIYLYAGIGPDLGITWIKNRINCCEDCEQSHRHTHHRNVGIGGIAKSGCQIFITPRFYFDIFADYLYLPMSFHNTTDIGGFKTGLGLSGRY